MYAIKEAFLISLCVSAEAAMAFLVVSALARHAGGGKARAAFALSLVLGMAAGVALVIFRASPLPAAVLPWLESSRILLTLFIVAAGIVSRREYAPVDAPGGGFPMMRALRLLLPCVGFFWLIYESAVLTATLGGLAALTEKRNAVCLAAALSVVAAAAAGALAESAAARLKPSSAMTPSALMFMLFALKMAGAATWGTDARPTAMWFIYFVDNTIHDMFHTLFVIFQFPDHPFLKDAVYQGILYFFKPVVHAVTAALAASLLVAAAWFCFARRPAPDVPASTRAPGIRLIKASVRKANFRVSAAFMAVIVMVWAGILHAQSRNNALYDPMPIPVVTDGGGMVIVPLAGQFELTAESRLRKYVYSDPERFIKFMTIKRRDGSIAIALDTCEICQPKGYAQLNGEYIICIYCKTPIPVSTVGEPGGCNPIPIPGAKVDGLFLRLPRKFLIETHEKAMAGKK